MMATDGHRVDSTKILKHLSMNAKAWQVLLFSATFNEAVKSFATKVVPNANQIFIPADCSLSLDVIKQHRVAVGTVEAKDVLAEGEDFPAVRQDWPDDHLRAHARGRQASARVDERERATSAR